MITKDNLTIIIQGPIHKIGAAAINNYLNYGKVIFSTDDCINDPIFKDYHYNFKRVKIIIDNKNPLIGRHDRNGIVDCDGGVYLQAVSTLNGLLNCDTEYFIKVRADEMWTNLTPFIQMMETGKIVSNNRFTRRATDNPFHMADTMFGGQTSLFLPAFKLLKTMLENKEFHTFPIMGRPKIMSAEQKITVALLRVLEPNFEFMECREIMNKYFLICPCDLMAPFLVNSSGWKIDNLPNPRSEFNSREWNTIDSISQV